MKIEKISVLHCTTNTSDKIYKVIIWKDYNNNNYYVGTSYGRRNSTLVVNPNIYCNTLNNAISKHSNIVYTKLKKGYVDITQPSDMPNKFTIDYVNELLSNAGILCADGELKENQYLQLKSMLNSNDNDSQVLAENIVLKKIEKLIIDI
tara:strand:+ start:1129 stop:1575 length:447 start_codon:yes stop_codon:yes gene_type:complete